MAKRALSTDAFLDKIDEITDAVMTDENLQKKIYAIGALLGKGVIDGTGLQKRGGKFGMQDLIMGIAAKFLGGQNLTGEQSTPTNSSGGNNPWENRQ